VRLLILYRPNSEHERTVDTFVRDFQHQHEVGKKIELISVDTREGAEIAKTYDILEFPAILALADDGSALSIWTGTPLPLMNEVAGYSH
jgi:hypothetical protein